MEDKTYLELLAENDEIARQEFLTNAADLLTTNFTSYEEDVDGADGHPDELEDQEEFRKEQGSHQIASLMTPPPKDLYKATTDVRYQRDTYVHVLSIDSRFRTDINQLSGNFLFKLLTPIKNVIAIRLSSLEIPNTWYNFSNARGNISMGIIFQQGSQVIVNITSGNYRVNTGQQDDILVELFTQLNNVSLFPNNSFSVSFNLITRKMAIGCYTNIHAPVGGYTYTNQPSAATETPVIFTINFATSQFSTRITNWGLGYNLGYDVKETLPAFIQQADYVLNITSCNYIFLSLNPDWRVIEHNQPDKTQVASFAKIIVDVPKNSIVYDNGQNTITKTYRFMQPANITTFTVTLRDEFEEYINLEGDDFSITLEVTEVLHSSLYESMRT